MNEPTPILNCRLAFRFKCPQAWDHLTITSNPKERNCGVCKKRVLLCETQEELADAAERGRCVVYNAIVDGQFTQLMGDLMPPEDC